METFEEFYKKCYFFKVHYFSNSGKTDYGVQTFVKDYDYVKIGFHDELLFHKRGDELSADEFNEFKEIIENYYDFYCKEFNIKQEEEEEIKSYIENNKQFLIEKIPFHYTDHYDVIYLNCEDEKILSNSGKKEIKSVEQLNKIDDDYLYCLIIMAVKNLESIENF